MPSGVYTRRPELTAKSAKTRLARLEVYKQSIVESAPKYVATGLPRSKMAKFIKIVADVRYRWGQGAHFNHKRSEKYKGLV